MSDPLDLKRTERRVWRDVQQDGLIEVMIGLMLLLTSPSFLRPALAFSPVFFLIFGPRVIEALRARFTYPRIGYAQLVSEKPGVTLRGIAVYVLIVVAAMALVLLITGDVTDVDAWTQWVPALAGVVFSGGFLYAAGKSGATRYYLFIVFAVGLGVIFSLLPAGHYLERMQRFLFALGGLLALWGVVMFLLFLRHPIQKEVDDARG